jgi:hypothetical protein
MVHYHPTDVPVKPLLVLFDDGCKGTLLGFGVPELLEKFCI